MSTRNEVLDALKTQIVANTTGVTVLRTAADPSDHSKVIAKAAWPTGVTSLAIVYGGVADIADDEKPISQQSLVEMAVLIYCYVKEDDNEQRDVLLCGLITAVENAVYADTKLGGFAKAAAPKPEIPDTTVPPPYAGATVGVEILYRRS